jgi:virginiamycin B lyase
MERLLKVIGLVILLGSVTQSASNRVISGTIKGPDGAPLKGIFVQARNIAKSNITVSVLSDKQGHYKIENLSPGEYRVSVRAANYQSTPPVGVKAAAGSSLDLTLKGKKAGWGDLAPYQAYAILPEGDGKLPFFKTCMNNCHAFTIQERWTREGWDAMITYMNSINPENPALSKGMKSVYLVYANAVLTVDGPLPRSPEDLPDYQKVKRGQFSNDATKIVYVDYDMPVSHRTMPMQFPWSAAPDKDGNLWVPYRFLANKIARLNPNTGEVNEFTLPNKHIAGIHTAVPAPDGTVWLNEIRPDKIAEWDPRTRQITEYQAAPQPDQNGKLSNGYKNAIRIDARGYVWSSGQPLTRFDPKTRTFKYFLDAPQQTYGLAMDKAGSMWFTAWEESKIGKVDEKTDKVTTYPTPSPESNPKRIQIDSDGIVWFAEHDTDKIGRFDPKTNTFKEYSLPGPLANPYALGIDRNHQIWYSSRSRDVVGRLDPNTGHVTEYPMPYSFNGGMREFFLDSQGRMWFGLPSHNKVGYFYLATGN